MNETLTLVLALVAGTARCDVLRRPVVDGSQGSFVQIVGVLVLREPAAANEHCPGWILLRRGGHWDRLLACLLGFVIARLDRDTADTSAERKSRLAYCQEASHAP